MSLTMLNELPRYECLQDAAAAYSTDTDSCALFLDILRTGNAVTEIESRYLATHGITAGRFAVMMLLRQAGGKSLKPSQIAEMTGVTRATMTGLLDTLERDDLVRRSIDTEDRRSMRIEATPACGELLDKVLPGYFRLVESVATVLTEEERNEFQRLTRRLREGLESAEAGASGSVNRVSNEPAYA